jgi:hypothetical protein
MAYSMILCKEKQAMSFIASPWSERSEDPAAGGIAGQALNL